MVKLKVKALAPEAAHGLREDTRSLLVNQIEPAQERKRHGRLQDPQEALTRFNIMAAVLLKLFGDVVPTFLSNTESLDKVKGLIKVRSPCTLRSQSFKACLWTCHLVSTVHAIDKSIACPPVGLLS